MIAAGAVLLIQDIIGGISSWFKEDKKLQQSREDYKLEKWKTKIAIEANKQRLASDTQSNNHDWEMANLADKDKILRWVSFILFTLPFVVALVFPHHIEEYFTKSIAVIPEWWKKTYMAMMGGIWGLSSLKNIIPSMLSSFKSNK